MSYCLNVACSHPENSPQASICAACGSTLLLQGRYRAIKQLAAGGFSRTFLAVDESQPFNPACVIKQFLPQAANAEHLETALTLFRSEGLCLSELGKHPQLPQLLAFFEQDQSWYLVQEWIDGRNLATILQEEGPFSASRVRQFLKDILPVLDFIHTHQLIHRDIKPQNIIYRIADRRPVLVDFGAAKVSRPDHLAQTGTVIGTAEYTAPEQARGKAVVASDIYGLGVTCIHLLTQVSPLDLFDHGQDTWVWPSYLKAPLLDADLEKILNRMIQRGTLQRYSSARGVLQDLQDSSKPFWRRLGKPSALAITATCGLLFALLGISWIRALQSPYPESANPSPAFAYSPAPPVSTERLLSTRSCIRCDLTNVNLSGLDLSGVDLESANLSGANLSNTILSRANLNSATLQEVNLSSSNLSGANLSSADLTNANLNNANLRNANLEYANLQDTNFENADMTGTKRSIP